MATSESQYTEPRSRGSFCLCICSLSPRRGARSLLSLSFRTARRESPASPTRPVSVCHRGFIAACPGHGTFLAPVPWGRLQGPEGVVTHLSPQPSWSDRHVLSAACGSENESPFKPPPIRREDPHAGDAQPCSLASALAPPSMRMAPRSWYFLLSALPTPVHLTVMSLLKTLQRPLSKAVSESRGTVCSSLLLGLSLTTAPPSLAVSPEDLGCSTAARPSRTWLPADRARGPARDACSTCLSPPAVPSWGLFMGLACVFCCSASL